MSNLTEKQQKVLAFVKEKSTEGLPPTVREICRATGIKSTSGVYAILCLLEDKGYIKRDTGTSRAIKLEGMPGVTQIPVLGKITAGKPILAVEDIEEYIPYSKSRSVGRELFALRVSGESMIGAGILDGDIIVCDKSAVVHSGEIGAAMIEDEATVKRIYMERGGYRLQPENTAFEPIFSSDAQILGKVISLIRDF